MTTPSIGFALQPCALGFALVAGTERGVCFVRFGTSDAALQKELKRAFPAAQIENRSAGRVLEWARSIADYVDGQRNSAEVPLDVRGSRFAERVWSALRQIPMGETRSYSEIARKLGSPGAARAVARAIVANPAPVAIPCHRVVLKNGRLSGDAGAIGYQRAMLTREGAM